MEKIFDELERGWDAFTELASHAHYHHPVVSATPAVEAPVSVLEEAKTAFKDGLAKLEGLDDEAIGSLEKVAANPGALKLITAAEGVLHLPPEAFEVGIAALEKVAALYPPAEAAPADPAAQPAA